MRTGIPPSNCQTEREREREREQIHKLPQMSPQQVLRNMRETKIEARARMLAHFQNHAQTMSSQSPARDTRERHKYASTLIQSSQSFCKNTWNNSYELLRPEPEAVNSDPYDLNTEPRTRNLQPPTPHSKDKSPSPKRQASKTKS